MLFVRNHPLAESYNSSARRRPKVRSKTSRGTPLSRLRPNGYVTEMEMVTIVSGHTDTPPSPMTEPVIAVIACSLEWDKILIERYENINSATSNARRRCSEYEDSLHLIPFTQGLLHGRRRDDSPGL